MAESAPDSVNTGLMVGGPHDGQQMSAFSREWPFQTPPGRYVWDAESSQWIWEPRE